MQKICRTCNRVQGYTLCLDCRRIDQARHREAYGSAEYQDYRTAALAAAGNRCHVCGNYANTADHLTPVEHGGSSAPENLIALCLRCNSQRQDRPWNEWIAWRRARGQYVRAEAMAPQHPAVFCGQITSTETPPRFRARPRSDGSEVGA